MRAATLAAARAFFDGCRTPAVRGIREFAEAELRIPDGPFAGRRVDADRQPYTRVLWEALDDPRYNRAFVVGPTQSGKTFSAFVVLILYHLFELCETTICGLPEMDMAGDKWRQDLRPAIEASRYRELLPRRGPGSKDGGNPGAIQFGNGVTLKFMGGGGGDKQRAAFTSRVLVVTETDGLDVAGDASKEADKFTQMEGRTRAFGSRKKVVAECTVTTPDGRSWREFSAGTASRLCLPCPHCGAYVTPEREHLKGWQGAATPRAAREGAAFHCPACDRAWTEAERRTANERAALAHRGQEVNAAGEATGDAPETETLGFRWSGVNNLFVTAGDLGHDEWVASKAEDRDNAEKEQKQFVWVKPYAPPRKAVNDLSIAGIWQPHRGDPAGRGPRGRDPADLRRGRREVRPALGPDRLEPAGRRGGGGLRDRGNHRRGVGRGAGHPDRAAGPRRPGHHARAAGRRGAPLPLAGGWVDSRYQPQPVRGWVRERADAEGAAGGPWLPTLGWGFGQRPGGKNSTYVKPGRQTPEIRHVGVGYHVARRRTDVCPIANLDADHFKGWLHERLACARACRARW